jgi:hypothetical protein
VAVRREQKHLATDETRIREIVRKIRVYSMFHPWLLESIRYGLEPGYISTIATSEFLASQAQPDLQASQPGMNQ